MSIEFPDTLVLKIEERDTDSPDIDHMVYILYDKKTHRFVIRGKRMDGNSCTYSFECELAKDLADFLTFIISEKNKWTYVLYNYDNLPNDSNEITFEFLNQYDEPNYELSGYDQVKYNRKSLLKNLRMLRNVFNYYN
jgi:hypothetical protein